MFLFLRLLFAHFVADYPLQTSQVYRWKISGDWGKWVHTLIIFIVSTLFVYPYWNYIETWIYLIGAALLHHLSDWAKQEMTLRGEPRWALYRYVLDQFGHVVVVAGVLLLDISKLRLEIPGNSLWAQFYNSDFWMLYGSLLLVATYFTTYFIETFKISYYSSEKPVPLPEAVKYYGILERACLFNLAFVGGGAWIVTPFLILPRFAVARIWPDSFQKTVRATGPLEISLSFILGILPGLLLRSIV